MWRSIPSPAVERRAETDHVTTVPTQGSIRPSIQRTPQTLCTRHSAQGPLTWFSPPVETVARGVAAEQSPATWSHREDLIPGSFTLAIHTIQSRIYRLHTGRVIRQIYYVPQDFDPVVATYFKSRRLIRIESFCHCRIVLLDPSDPRCNLCPDGYRTIEVNFHEEKGRYLGFANLLNAVATSKIYTARVVATVFRRLSGVECDLSPEDLLKLESAEPRQTYYTLRSDLKSGTGTALAPKIDSV
nr:unnamed protein product [Spirometra erinaceieuropaei]